MSSYQIRNMPAYSRSLLFLKHLVSKAAEPISKLDLNMNNTKIDVVRI